MKTTELLEAADGASEPSGVVYWAPSTCGFYLESMRDRYGDNWPTDTVEITLELYSSLFSNQPPNTIIGTVMV